MFKLAIVVVYVVAMLLVGWWSMRRTHTVSDFFLGGRNLGPWLSAFAYGTTYFSAVLFIGYAGKLGWGFGIHTMWIVIGNALIGCLLAWQWLGPPTRRMTGRLGALTMPEFLAVRYQSPLLKLAAAVLIFVFLVPYSASVYMGLSYLFEKNMGIRYEYALVFLALLTGVYIIMGGYLALAITDLIRGIIELVGVVVMVVYLAHLVGGFGQATVNLMNPQFSPGLHAPTSAANPIPGWLTLASLVVVTSFGPWGLPQMVQKFYSIKSETQIRAATIVCTIFALLMAFGAYYTGALTHLFYTKLPVAKIDELIPYFLTQNVPASIALVILILVFSASMSSLSSLVLVSSSAIAMDLYGGMINRQASRKTLVTLMRVFCGVFVACSLVIALRQPTVIVNLMVISWGVLAGSFIGPFFYGLFWRRTTKAGAYAGFFGGLAVAVGLFLKFGAPGIPFSGAAAIVTSMVLVPLVSLVTPAMDRALVEKAFGDGEPAAPAAEQVKAKA